MEQTLPGSMSVRVVPARVNGADYFRVRVGPFISRDAAERARNDLSVQGVADGRVVAAN